MTRSALPSSMVPFDHSIYTTSASILASIGLTSLILSFVALQHANHISLPASARLSNIVSQMFPLGLLYLLLLIPYMLLGHYYFGDIFPPLPNCVDSFRRDCDNDLGQYRPRPASSWPFMGTAISHILPSIEHSLAREALRYRSKARASWHLS